MTEGFLSLLNMSLTASYVIIAVLIIRVFLKRAPKFFSYVIWLPVLIRLAFPFSMNSALSVFSLLKHQETADGRNPAAVLFNGLGSTQNYGGNITDNSNTINTNPQAISETAVGYPGILLKAAAIIWILGVIALVVYSVISYMKTLRNIETATLVRDNIFETDRITSPFVCGIIRPRIYIPAGLAEPELTYILTHEQTHIQRRDYIIKPLSFLILIIHWFNPLVWLAFALMTKDMEMSCDESVIRKMGDSAKASYSNSLLLLSVRRSGLVTGSPLAFGESSIKSRIKNILNYKRPSFWAAALVVIATVLFIVGFATNPQDKEPLVGSDYSGMNIKELLADKTKYVGDNSKVVALIDALPLPRGLFREKVELQTEKPPYGIKIYVDMKDASAVLKAGAINGETLFPNSVLLFSLIENVDTINYELTDNTGKYDGASYGFTFTRRMVEKLMNEDVRKYSTSPALFEELIDKTTKMHVHVEKNSQEGENATDKAIGPEVESFIKTIITPGASSNPGDYIKAHQTEYESILKLGDNALQYLLSQFKDNNVKNDLRGQIIMALCKDLLGTRNNVDDPSLLPTEWFSGLKLYQETVIGDYRAEASDLVEQLIYDTTVSQYSNPQRGFTVVAPTIFGSYEEEDRLKVFVTVFASTFKLYNKTLSEEGGSVIPAAITYKKDSDGSYTLEKYEKAKDGSYFSPSIKDFCTEPVSGKRIKGLYEKIIGDYGDNGSRQELLRQNLIEHLKANNLSGVSLKQTNGELLPLT